MANLAEGAAPIATGDGAGNYSPRAGTGRGRRAVDIAFFIGRRVLAMIAILIIVSFAVFALLYAAPGSVEQVLLGTTPSTPETLAAIRERYHLNDSFMAQYWDWAKNAVTLDFGRSIRTDEAVGTLLKERFALSLELGIYAFGIAAICGIPLGIIAALRKRRALDRAIVGFSVLGVSAPAFASGVFLLYVFAVLLEWFPAYGQGDTPGERLWHLTLPAITLEIGRAHV